MGAAHLAGSPLPWFALLALPALLLEAWRRTAVPAGKDEVSRVSRSALRAVAWGSLMWVAARTGPAGRPALDAAANLGVGTAAVAALVAIARIAPRPGLLKPHKQALSLDAATFAGLLWAIATALPLGFALLPAERVRLDPLMIDYATTSAAIASLLVFVAASFRLHALRRLELGVGDRASGALSLAITTFSVAIPAGLLDVAPPDRILPVAVCIAALSMTWAATTPEPTTVSTGLRAILSILILGTPIILGGGAVLRSAPEHSGAILLLATTLCIFVGLIARAVAKPLGPEQSRWLDAIEAASRGALQPEPDSALCAALEALGKTATTPEARPAIFRNNPPEMLSVDIAGYLHVEPSEAPLRLYELAKEEPERTLRAEALQALAVRRPEVRPLIAWFEDRRAFSATLVVDQDGPIGFILLPAGTRTSAMTLEEARAVRVLADRISALLAVSSALARSRDRELKAVARADRVDVAGTALRQQNEAIARLEVQQADTRARQSRLEAAQNEVAELKRESEVLVERRRSAEQAADRAAGQIADLVALKARSVKTISARKSAERKRVAALQRQQDALAKLLRKKAGSRASSSSVRSFRNGSGRLSYPVQAPITSGFGYRFHPILHYSRLHAGTDFGAPCGTPVRAAAPGTVIRAGRAGGFGNQVVLDHGRMKGKNLASSYNHLSRFVVRHGHVRRGQVIAYSGTTGLSTGCHLHFEVYVNGTHVNPMSWL